MALFLSLKVKRLAWQRDKYIQKGGVLALTKRILITGCAGFVGFHISKILLTEGFEVIGIDNMNDYYDPKLKESRLNLLKKHQNFIFHKGNLEHHDFLTKIFKLAPPDTVINLAAQAGVRYSLTHPDVYIQSNLVGFANLLESCKNNSVKHLIYASSSSVYGANKKIPFSVTDRVDQPISLYAATKKANELMAYTYSHLYQLPTTGLRLFTVYGPWGRPDMAIYSFTNSIMNEQPIEIYNYGNMKRDFTFIDDVVESVIRLIKKEPPSKAAPPYQLFNIGNHQPVQIMKVIQLLEKNVGKKAIKQFLPIQSGDVPTTFADTTDLESAINFKPTVSIEEGIKRFINWYKQYHNIT